MMIVPLAIAFSAIAAVTSAMGAYIIWDGFWGRAAPLSLRGVAVLFAGFEFIVAAFCLYAALNFWGLA